MSPRAHRHLTAGPPPTSTRARETADGVCASRRLLAHSALPAWPWESSGRLRQRAPACVNTLTRGRRQTVTKSHRADRPVVKAGSCLVRVQERRSQEPVWVPRVLLAAAPTPRTRFYPVSAKARSSLTSPSSLPDHTLTEGRHPVFM